MSSHINDKKSATTEAGGQDGLTAALNASGIPFQQWCVAYIQNHEKARFWRVDREEYPVAVGDREARIDFVASAKRGAYNIVAECKLANAKYKTWLFPKSSNEHFPEILAYRVAKDGHNPGYKNTPPQLGRAKTNFYNGLSAYQSGHALEIKKHGGSDNGREKNWAVEPVQMAAYQVALSCFGFMKERWDHLEKGSAGHEHFFPVVFTMADLKYVEYSPQCDKEISGLVYTDVPWAVYHFGVSQLIWAGIGNEFNWEYVDKTMPVLFVNARLHMADFFESLSTNMQLFI